MVLFLNSDSRAAGYLGWSTDVTLLTGKGAKVALGYGAETHSGEQLLEIKAPTPFRQVYGQFYESNGTGIEGGMSGGPVICTQADGLPALCGTVVSGSDFPLTGGIRAINQGASNFIINYLSDTIAK